MTEQIQQIIDGDQVAAARFYHAHKVTVLKAIKKIVKDEQVREDIAQQAWLNIFKNLHKFRGASNIDTWLYQIARNAAFYSFRERAKKVAKNSFSIDVKQDQEDEPFDIPLIDHRFDVSDLDLDKMQEAIQELAPGYRSVIRLRLEELSMAEIAQVLGVTEGNVKSQMSRAMKHLKKKLADKPKAKIQTAGL